MWILIVDLELIFFLLSLIAFIAFIKTALVVISFIKVCCSGGSRDVDHWFIIIILTIRFRLIIASLGFRVTVCFTSLSIVSLGILVLSFGRVVTILVVLIIVM